MHSDCLSVLCEPRPKCRAPGETRPDVMFSQIFFAKGSPYTRLYEGDQSFKKWFRGFGFRGLGLGVFPAFRALRLPAFNIFITIILLFVMLREEFQVSEASTLNPKSKA